MQIPRVVLLFLCAVLTATAYYLILFTNWGNAYHGGTYGGVVLTDAVAVLAVAACIEVVRREKVVPLRAVAGAVGVPLVLVLALMLWFGVARTVAG